MFGPKTSIVQSIKYIFLYLLKWTVVTLDNKEKFNIKAIAAAAGGGAGAGTRPGPGLGPGSGPGRHERARAAAGLQHPAVGGAAHRLHHLLRGDDPALRLHPAAERQAPHAGAGVRQPSPDPEQGAAGEREVHPQAVFPDSEILL